MKRLLLLLVLAAPMWAQRSSNASGLQGYPICTDVPTDTYALSWSAASGCWKPTAVTSLAGGTVTSVGLAGTSRKITVTGTSPITGAGSWTLTLPADLLLPLNTAFTASTTAGPSFNIPSGVAPTTPVTGDFWNQSGVPKFHNGTAVKSLAFLDSNISGTAAAIAGGSGGQVAFQSGAGVTAFSSGLAYNDTTKVLGLIGGYTAGQSGTGTGTYAINGITSGTLTLSAADAAGTWTLKFPTTGGTNGYFLQTNGSGVTTWAAAGAGAVTTVGFTGGLLSVADPTTTPAITVAGTSGGIPYFSSASTWASSGALTANLPVIGGGAGVAPTVGTRSGNTTAFVTTTGAQTGGRCVEIDANGNHIAAAAGCAAGTGTVSVVGAGALTSTALVTGGGTTTLQTPAATATMDASGNISTPGTITSGAGGSVAGAYALGQGTAPTAASGEVGWMAPASVTTPFFMTLPGAPTTGFLLNTGTTDPSTITFVASTGTGNVVRATSPALTTPDLGTPSAINLTKLYLSGASGAQNVTFSGNSITSAHAVANMNYASNILLQDNTITTPVGAEGGDVILETSNHDITVNNSGNVVMQGSGICDPATGGNCFNIFEDSIQLALAPLPMRMILVAKARKP
jgi:hypothetical protein